MRSSRGYRIVEGKIFPTPWILGKLLPLTMLLISCSSPPPSNPIEVQTWKIEASALTRETGEKITPEQANGFYCFTPSDLKKVLLRCAEH